MAEVIKRDKQLRLLATMYAVIKRDAKVATPAMARVWSKQLNADFETFKTTHAAVIDRAGATEIEEQHSIYDDGNAYYYKGCLLIEDLLVAPAAPPVDVLGPLRIRHLVAEKRLALACEHIVRNIANMRACELDLERNGLEGTWTLLQEMVMNRIAAGANEDEVLVQEMQAADQYRVTMRLMADARARFMAEAAAVAVAEAAGPAVANAVVAVGADTLRMPHLEITPFDGLFEKWEAFRESFHHGVHARINMAGVQKLQYLKSVLRGEPEELIQNFSLTNDNYAAAWALLQARYNNEHELVTCHLRVLTTLPACTESADDLRRVTNKTSSSLMALRNLGRPVDEWNDWVVFHVCEVLDTETRRMWKHQLANAAELPTWAELDQFLQRRIRALASDGGSQSTQSSRSYAKPSKVRTHHNTAQRTKLAETGGTGQCACFFCGDQHLISFCTQFRQLSVTDRRRAAADKALCFVCLVPGHRADACKSTRMCHVCDAKHNSMLHTPDNNGADEQPVRAHTGMVTAEVTRPRAQVFLATAIVNVRDVGGGVHRMRALLDQGSEASIVSEQAAHILQLPRNRENVTVEGLGGVNAGQCKQSIMMQIADHHGLGYSVDVCALVLPRVTSRAKRASVQTDRFWPHVQDLLLADPEFMQSHTFDILLGGEVYGTMLRPGLRQSTGLPTAQNTMFGWIVSGTETAVHDNTSVVTTHHAAIEEQLAKFWEMEEPTSVRRHTAEEEKCEQFFDETVQRDGSGRLHVRLPMKHSDITFGESQRFAVLRQLQIERKFSTNPDFAQKYRQFMAQYMELGHMVEVVDDRVDLTRKCAVLPMAARREYYIPHHAVTKESSTTTKLRVVFDASRRTTNGVSLNEEMMVGPRLQDDLTAIMMRWRKFRVAFCADVEKMYRQIVVDAPDSW